MDTASKRVLIADPGLKSVILSDWTWTQWINFSRMVSLSKFLNPNLHLSIYVIAIIKGLAWFNGDNPCLKDPVVSLSFNG